MNKPTLLINLVWFNKTLSETNRFVWPDRSRIEEMIAAWAQTNPNVPIMFWMYAPTCTTIQIDKTRSYLNEMCKEGRIRLGNFADICPNPDFFKATGVDIYWKVDVARYIIALAMLEQFETVCYVDLDLAALDVSASLEARESEYARRLAYFGILYCTSDNTQSGIENGFFIMSRTNKFLQDAIKIVMIKSPTEFIRQVQNDHIYSMYNLGQWGFMYSSVVFLLEHMFRYPDNVKIRFSGTSLGVRSKFISLKQYLQIMSRHPVLILEHVECKYFSPTRLVPYEEYPPISRTWLRFSMINCSESTNSLKKDDYERLTRLHSGIGHAKSIIRKAHAAVEDFPEIILVDMEKISELYKHAIDV